MLTPDLPQHLINLQREIEDMAKHPISWKPDNQIDGEMSAKVEHNIPIISYRNFTAAGAAEELLHLKLVLCGIPQLTYNEIHGLSKQVAKILHNVLHHQIIYPMLEKWGYNPRSIECKGIKSQMIKLKQTDLNRLESSPALEALFAMVFVRGKLDCNSKEVEKLLDIFFGKSKTVNARIIGERVISVIQQLRGSDPDKYRTVLTECLEILSLTNTIGISG